jgi:HEAT repeat protein
MGRLARVALLGLVVGVAVGPRAAAQPSGPFPVFEALEQIAGDSGQSKEQRLAAIDGLGKAAHPSVVPALRALLGDAQAEIRAAAAGALGWPGNQRAVELLVARATDPGEASEVRTTAIGALGRIGDPRALGPVEELSRAPSPALRREALLALMDSALAQRGDRVAAGIRLLEDLDQEGYPRARAATALGASADARAVEPLVRALKDPRIPAGFTALPSPDALTGQAKTMAERLRSLHNVRAHAARALGVLGATSAEAALLDAAGDPDPLVRIQSVAALGRLRSPAAVPRVIQALEDPDLRVQETAVTSLGVLGDAAAVPFLVRALEAEDPHLRERAAAALGRLKAQTAREPLTRLAEDDPEASVRQAAHRALRALDRDPNASGQ